MQLIRSWPGPEHSQNLPTPVPVVGFLLSALIPPERPKLALCVDSGCPSPPSVFTRGLQTQKKKKHTVTFHLLILSIHLKRGEGPRPLCSDRLAPVRPGLFIYPACCDFIPLSFCMIHTSACTSYLSVWVSYGTEHWRMLVLRPDQNCPRLFCSLLLLFSLVPYGVWKAEIFSNKKCLALVTKILDFYRIYRERWTVSRDTRSTGPCVSTAVWFKQNCSSLLLLSIPV